MQGIIYLWLSFPNLAPYCKVMSKYHFVQNLWLANCLSKKPVVLVLYFLFYTFHSAVIKKENIAV